MPRPMTMLRTTLHGLVVLLAVAGCDVSGSASAPPSGAETRATAAPEGPGAVPAEFAAACGKPGSRVLTGSSVTVTRADCDLTGVSISSPGKGGAVVPQPGRGVSNSGGLSLSTAPNGDVSVSVTG